MFKLDMFKLKREKRKLSEERENFIRVYKKFLETLSTIFYPLKLEWYEYIILLVAGILTGIGFGYMLGLIFKGVLM
ncbi:MAG: hypothetical protein QXH77_03870 [Desulfurococcaceae archaeon]